MWDLIKLKEEEEKKERTERTISTGIWTWAFLLFRYYTPSLRSQKKSRAKKGRDGNKDKKKRSGQEKRAN